MQTTRLSLLQQLRDPQNSIAWSRFVEIYSPLVTRWVTSLNVPQKSRNDVTQEVFIVLLGKVSQFKYDATKSFRGWLRTVTLNKCRDYFRKSQKATEPQFLSHIEIAEGNESDFLTQKEYREYVAKAALALMKLHFSETTWRACWEHVAEGKPAKQVAAELGITVNAVYLARGRVLKRMRAELVGLWE